MRPDEREIDEELRGHIALAIKERVDRGEDPEVARRAAHAEVGYLPRVRESMRQVWYSRWFDAASDFVRDMRVGARSLAGAKGLALAVIITLGLGIGANVAIFSVVRGVLLTPLVNRDEDRLVYIRQTAATPGAENMTFSVPEIADLTAGVTSVAAFGDFSTIDFTMIGIGEPRVVHAGVVSGRFFEVMGLRPVLGRLLQPTDDGPGAAGAVVLTHRFWSTALASDPDVLGRTIRLDTRTATVVGVLEPSVPYPVDTEIIANLVTSPHHLDATMVTGRTHRMTELFGRLKPGVTVEQARAELQAAHAAIWRAHPEDYAGRAEVTVSVRTLREQIATPARAILLLLLATAGVVFIVACSNVANLILARSVRREGELAVRAALGASRGALRRTLLAESLVLCGAGALVGVLLASPLMTVLARFAARYSVRALEVTMDTSLLWLGVALALAAAVLLAFVPRLPAAETSTRGSLATTGGLRITPGTNRRLRLFATAQVACSFVLLVGAGMLLAALVSLQTTTAAAHAPRVLAIDVPLPIQSFGPKTITFVDEAMRRIAALPGVSRVAAGNVVPWRDLGKFGPFSFGAEGFTPADGADQPLAVLRNVTPGYFATLGVPLVSGRDFTDDDRGGGEPVAIVSATLAARLFPGGEAVNRQIWWTDPVFGNARRRIVGVAADLNDDSVLPLPAMTIYHPLRQVPFGGRLFVQAAGGDPYALVPAITRAIHEVAAEQPVERAATLEDIRAALMTPDRVNAFVATGFAGVALAIAMVGVAGVLAFSVSARTREFGVRLAMGSTPRDLRRRVLREGVAIVMVGIVAGVGLGYALAALGASFVDGLRLPGLAPLAGAASVLAVAAVAAALLPARRAARLDVLRALRTE
jgi:putative ABC transport system permease protein